MHEPYPIHPERAAADEKAAAVWTEEVTWRSPRSPLRITFTRPPATLRLSGAVNASNRAILTRALSRATAGPDHSLCVNLSGLEFCDLAGLRALISVAARKRVALAGLPAEAHTILKILHWDATPGVTALPPAGGGPASPLRGRSAR